MSTVSDSKSATASPSENHTDPRDNGEQSRSQAGWPDEESGEHGTPPLEMSQCPECGGRRFVSKLLVYEITGYDEGDESTHASTSTGESTVRARDASERSRAYLTEKNRLLTERVDELETTLAQKNERIATLETEVKQLTAELADRDSEHPHNAHSVTRSVDARDEETASVWTRTKRLFQGESE